MLVNDDGNIADVAVADRLEPIHYYERQAAFADGEASCRQRASATLRTRLVLCLENECWDNIEPLAEVLTAIELVVTRALPRLHRARPCSIHSPTCRRGLSGLGNIKLPVWPAQSMTLTVRGGRLLRKHDPKDHNPITLRAGQHTAIEMSADREKERCRAPPTRLE
jgi:hypothetical protein